MSQGKVDYGALFEPHRRAITAHCYRMLGSFAEAEEVTQEALLKAWERYASYAGTGSLKAWLHGIATHACLDALRERRRRKLPQDEAPAAAPAEALAPPAVEEAWLEPIPDTFLAEEHYPEARIATRESVALAFLAAIQHLPPRQRAVLLLLDVLDYSAKEAAEWLDTSVASINSALQRARAGVEARAAGRSAPTSPAAVAEEAELLRRYVQAWERTDPGLLATVLRDDAFLSMPPNREWYQGREAVLAFTARIWEDPAFRFRFLPTRANGSPALGLYLWSPQVQRFLPFGVQVLRLEAGGVGEIVGFLFPGLFSAFALPPALAVDGAPAEAPPPAGSR